jgi:hypothetical protein
LYLINFIQGVGWWLADEVVKVYLSDGNEDSGLGI